VTKKKAWDPDRWTFRIEETRNLCWTATADDQQGTVIERTAWSDDPDEVLRTVKDEAAEITRRRREAARRTGLT
jgi:hypothetical protein